MLTLKNIEKYYSSKQGVVQALKRINVTFTLGEFIVITGESGSGKSTLLNVMSGLDTYEQGEMLIEGKETAHYDSEAWERYRKNYIGFVFQQYNIIDAFSVYKNIALALTIQGYDPTKKHERTLELIAQVGLTSHIHHKAAQLSGGQKQRVSIARALAKDSPIIIADEPTGNLDTKNSESIVNLLHEISHNKLVIMVTHDGDLVREHATRIIRMFDGEIVEDVAKKTPTPLTEYPIYDAKPMSLRSQIGIAIKSGFATPKKTIFTLLISVFIVFAFTLTYGAYVEQSHTQQNLYHPYIMNPNPQRLIVSNRDLSVFTDAQLESIVAMRDVVSVMPVDPVLDLTLHYQTIHDRFNYEYYQSVRPLPAKLLTTRSLTEGRLPQTANEIVIEANDKHQLHDTIELAIGDDFYYDFNDPTLNKQSFTIVGMHQNNQGQWFETTYFHEDFFTDPETIFLALKAHHYIHFDLPNNQTFTLPLRDISINDTLNNDEIAISRYLLDNYDLPNGIGLLPVTVTSNTAFYDLPLNQPLSVVELTPTEPDSWRSSIQVNSEVMASWMVLQTYQVSVMVQDGFAAYRVQNQLDKTLYYSMYPADYQDDFTAIFSVIQQMFQAISSLFLLVIMYFASYLALKNVMRNKQKDYVIMRSMGASKKALNQINIIELNLIMLAAYVLVITVFIVAQYTPLNIPNYLRYFRWIDYFVVLAALLGMSGFLGIRFNRKIFSTSVITALRNGVTS